MIKYGGVVLKENTEIYKNICYFLQAVSKKQAEDFVRNDPYYSLYNHIEIKKFVQRVPQE